MAKKSQSETKIAVINAQKPNIAFVGTLAKREPLRQISDGMDTIELPEDQSKPFYHEDAVRIIQIVPELYKPVIDK